MKTAERVSTGGRLEWRCYGAECRELIARNAGSTGYAERVELRVELVRMPSPDGVPAFGRSRYRAMDHRPDWTGKSPEFRTRIRLPVRVHCIRCGRTQELRDVVLS
jgi:hypothetical protein